MIMHYLLRNAVIWALDEALPVMVEGPGMLDVTLWRQKHSLTVHLVNLTEPDDDAGGISGNYYLLDRILLTCRSHLKRKSKL